MYITINGKVYKIVHQDESGAWVIDTEPNYKLLYLSAEQLQGYTKIPEPDFIMDNRVKLTNHVLTKSQMQRFQMISPMLENADLITDAKALRSACNSIAENNGTTKARVERTYRKFMATYGLGNAPRETKYKTANETDENNFMWAIRTIYFSPHRVSLQDAYDIMLLQKYTVNGELVKDVPTFWAFRKFYYSHGMHEKSSRSISRNGLSNFLRNERMLYGSGMKWKDKIGSYQMDSTVADIYLVSRFDRNEVVGRPSIFLAVDTATQLIAGVYVGFETGCAGALACLCNVVYDKVEYCRQYGVEIEKWQWATAELPGEIITDKGCEFLGDDVTELCTHFGMVCQSMPPFRPDRKGLVEMTFDMLQRRYKNLLRGKGVVEADYKERWATDYKQEAVLNIDEFTQVLIHCIVYLNSARVLGNQFLSEEIFRDNVELCASKLWIWYKQHNRSNLISVDKEDFYKFTLSHKKATIQKRGIHVNGLWYAAPIIEELGLHIGSKVNIAFDGNDISRIYIINGKDYVSIPLASSSEQFSGLTQQEFEGILKKQSDNNRNLKKFELDARLKMIENINSIVRNAGKPKNDDEV